MRFGLTLPHFGPGAGPDALAGTAMLAEGHGFESLWTLDRLLAAVDPRTPYAGTPDGRLPHVMHDVLEPLSVLSYLAGITTRVRLCTGVLVFAFRSPVLLGRMGTTIDVLSGGRFGCGLGLGWSEDEYLASGVGFADKGGRFDDYLEALLKVWTEDTPGHDGTYYSVPRSHIGPRPHQRPHPPLWIGGESDAALRRAAKYGTGWYASGYLPFETLTQRITTVLGYVTAAGKDPETYDIGVWAPFSFTREATSTALVGPPEHLAAGVRAYEAAGVTELVLAAGMTPGSNPIEDIPRFAREVMAPA